MITADLVFKSARQEREFMGLDSRIKAILFFVAHQMKEHWDHQAVVTSIWRSKEEQADLLVKGGVKNSPHLDWRAADIRLNNFKAKKDLPKLLTIINQKFPRSDGKPTAIAHGTGANFHLHLQVPKI